jgi:predicted dithiol-disulfide oxidoreductase (DUF899 family)
LRNIRDTSVRGTEEIVHEEESMMEVKEPMIFESEDAVELKTINDFLEHKKKCMIYKYFFSACLIKRILTRCKKNQSTKKKGQRVFQVT